MDEEVFPRERLDVVPQLVRERLPDFGFPVEVRVVLGDLHERAVVHRDVPAQTLAGAQEVGRSRVEVLTQSEDLVVVVLRMRVGQHMHALQPAKEGLRDLLDHLLDHGLERLEGHGAMLAGVGSDERLGRVE